MPDPASFLYLPVDLFPEQEEAELEYEIQQHLVRQTAAQDFLNGCISYEDYLDCLADQGWDSAEIHNDWESNFSGQIIQIGE